MTTDDQPAATPASETLQFEHADFTAAAAPAALACAACRQPIAGAYYEISGKTLCGACSNRIAAHFEAGATRPAEAANADPKAAEIAKSEPGKPRGGKAALEPGLGQALVVVAGSLALLVAYAYAAPLMAGSGNIINLVIIFFALLQAW